ncbi:ANTAR domain-containing protein [Streptomyces sp. 3211.6]|uniref:ANTAR domain-containing protein n=1 Tax=Streptomyces TaxID=1883 RepID=UPI000CC1B54B|nr:MULTISPECIES: ANTAR domain-containing protein [Streptomyces]RKT02840.1 ANTAR domain-containing protein [Streptomyces sp. 3211.6]RPF44164.1 ANTAR domain-containing protein [Streptomyces sp. Ag109_G2-6]
MPLDRSEEHDPRARGDPGQRAPADGPGDVVRELLHALDGVPSELLPSRLCDAVLVLLPVSGLAVSTRGEGGGGAVPFCASDATAGRLVELQSTLQEGPAVRALEVFAPVLAPDLAGGSDARRWPLFAPRAVEAGARAVFSLPLGTPTVVLGTMDLYRDSPGMCRASDLRVAMLAADAVTVLLAAFGHGPAPVEGVAAWLHDAENHRTEVYQAAGMIMSQLKLGADEALALLHARAFREGGTATEVARAVIGHATDFREND